MTLKIAIDAGHGPNTPGKRSPDGMREYWFNSAVANAMKAELEKYEGVSVLFTHEDGRDVPLTERTNKANRWGADVLVSIHANAYLGRMGGHGGIDTFVYSTSGHSYKIAQIVQRNLIAATELRDRGVKVANFHMLRETEMPAILIEHGFMDSTTDLPYLKSDAYRKLCGVTNAKSIAEYYKLRLKPSVAAVSKKKSVWKPMKLISDKYGIYDVPATKWRESASPYVGRTYVARQVVTAKGVHWYELHNGDEVFGWASEELLEAVPFKWARIGEDSVGYSDANMKKPLDTMSKGARIAVLSESSDKYFVVAHNRAQWVAKKIVN
jgi:N-acetylmuramoyl-L-alanine amidase